FGRRIRQADARLEAAEIMIDDLCQARFKVPTQPIIQSQLGSKPPLILCEQTEVAVIDANEIILRIHEGVRPGSTARRNRRRDLGLGWNGSRTQRSAPEYDRHAMQVDARREPKI